MTNDSKYSLAARLAGWALVFITASGCAAVHRAQSPYSSRNPEAAEDQSVKWEQDAEALESRLGGLLLAQAGPNCSEACSWVDAICELSDSICEVGSVHPDSDEIAERCARSRVRCTKAVKRATDVCECPGLER